MLKSNKNKYFDCNRSIDCIIVDRIHYKIIQVIYKININCTLDILNCLNIGYLRKIMCIFQNNVNATYIIHYIVI